VRHIEEDAHAAEERAAALDKHAGEHEGQHRALENMVQRLQQKLNVCTNDRGRAVQVDPMKPMLKAPGTNLLTLKHDEPLSIFAFKLDLRHYTVRCSTGTSRWPHKRQWGSLRTCARPTLSRRTEYARPREHSP